MTTATGGWVRYRLFTRSVADPRPLVFNEHYPWWCSGEAGDGSYAVIIAFLPASEDVKTYWDDAFDVEGEPCEGPSFTSRFPQPRWYKAGPQEDKT